MTILSEHGLDVPANYYDLDRGKTVVQQSVAVAMQLDFYGSEAAMRARMVANLWPNHYAVAALKNGQPLYSKDPQQLALSKEQAQYGPRWGLEVALQYNPEFEYDQMFLGLPTITLTKP